jgi:hypothetical protein
MARANRIGFNLSFKNEVMAMPISPDATIPFDEDDIGEIVALAKNADKLSEFVSKSAQITPTIGIRPIADALSEGIGVDPSSLSMMANAIVRAFRTCDDYDSTADEVAKMMARSLETIKVPAETIKLWQDGQTKIVEAMNALKFDHPLVVSFTAQNEWLSMPNAITSMAMSTNTRPVFDEAKKRILFTVITHTLTIDVHEGHRQHREISLSLDAGDLRILRMFCDDAEQAAETLKANISGPSGVPWEGAFDDDDDEGEDDEDENAD